MTWGQIWVILFIGALLCLGDITASALNHRRDVNGCLTSQHSTVEKKQDRLPIN